MQVNQMEPRWQHCSTIKDVQGILRNLRAATTTDIYMQEIPQSVQATIDAICAELRNHPDLNNPA